MARAPFQVLVFPYRFKTDTEIEFAIFKRGDFREEVWQGIAGGGENKEKPIETARREAFEEGGISPDSPLIVLDSMATVPVIYFGEGGLWGEDIFAIPEYTFGVQVANQELRLSQEHAEYRWVTYEEALELLKWDSNKNALWELNQRLIRKLKQKEADA
jgi:dATP pyrophosphohydrolase